MIKVIAHKISSAFRHPFTISKATKTHQPALLIEMEYFGIKGWGEAPAITYYDVTVDSMIAQLEAKRKFIEKFSLTDPERYWHYLHHLLPKDPFLVCALDMAAWDIFGKMKKKQLYQYWGLDPAFAPQTSYTIGIDMPEKMVAKMREKPWPVYKIKVGFENDVEMIAALRKETNAPFMADANGGWTVAQALDKIPKLKGLGVVLVEQPLAKEHTAEMPRLFENAALPLFADESCVFESDLPAMPGKFHGINIKLTKCSGLTPAKRMIDKAKQLGLRVMLGSMNETSIGTSAIAQLAGLADHLDLDGPMLLTADRADGVTFENGKLTYANGFGIGVNTHRSSLTTHNS